MKDKILLTLKEADKPMAVQEIHKLNSNVDLATVYRNVNKLLEEKKISELRLKKGESLYEINDDEHQHAVCKICGKVEHIHVNTRQLLKDLKIKGFKVEDIEITIKGHCKK